MLVGSFFPISKLTIKLQYSKQCNTDNKMRHVDQQNRIESPKINTYIYGEIIFNRVAKIIQWGMNSLATSGAGTT